MADKSSNAAPPQSPPGDGNAENDKPQKDNFEQTFARSVEAIEKRNGKSLNDESKFLFHRELWNALHRS